MGNPDLSAGRFVVSINDECEGVLFDKSWATREEAIEHGPAHILEVVGNDDRDDVFFVCELITVKVVIPENLGDVVARHIHKHSFRGWEDLPRLHASENQLRTLHEAVVAAVQPWIAAVDITGGETMVSSWDEVPWPASA